MSIITYLDQIKQKCEQRGIFLRRAFKQARIHGATYSRTRRGLTELKLRTAQELDKAIDELTANRNVSSSEHRRK